MEFNATKCICMQDFNINLIWELSHQVVSWKKVKKIIPTKKFEWKCVTDVYLFDINHKLGSSQVFCVNAQTKSWFESDKHKNQHHNKNQVRTITFMYVSSENCNELLKSRDATLVLPLLLLLLLLCSQWIKVFNPETSEKVASTATVNAPYENCVLCYFNSRGYYFYWLHRHISIAIHTKRTCDLFSLVVNLLCDCQVSRCAIEIDSLYRWCLCEFIYFFSFDIFDHLNLNLAQYFYSQVIKSKLNNYTCTAHPANCITHTLNLWAVRDIQPCDHTEKFISLIKWHSNSCFHVTTSLSIFTFW